jgi:integrase
MRAKSSNRRVTLAIRVRLKSGERQYATPVITPNGKLKPFYALIHGQKEFHPEGVYVLRYRSCEGKQVWETVGTDPQLASIAKLRRENALQAEDLGLISHSAQKEPEPAAIDRQSVSDDCQRYLHVVAGTTRRRTLSSYRHALRQFMDTCGLKYTRDLTKSDVQNFVSTLKKEGLSPRTCANRVCVVRSFLRWAGYPDVVSRREIPRYTEKVVAAYSTKQMIRLLNASSMEQRPLWQFFLGSGGREQEVMYATWADIDFDTGLFTVREKPSMGFFIKDSQERSIPLPDDLLKALRDRKAHHPSDHLLFPAPGGKADGHFLRKLKRTAFNAGLNCGHCVTKMGSSCASAPVCRTWELHRFRKTMATLHHEAGMSARTLMRLLGHSDFATTLKYLEAADVRSESMRTAVNLSFRSLFETTPSPPV